MSPGTGTPVAAAMIAVLAAVLAAVLTALSTAPRAHADIIAGMPDAIVCSVKDPSGVLPWERLVFYVSARMSDGRTLYKSATSDPVILLVDSAGTISGANLADCDGRGIDALRREGRAVSLVSTKQDTGEAAR